MTLAATAAIVAAPFSMRHQPIADKCFRDTGRLYLAEDGSYYQLEWTPTLNKKERPLEQLPKMIADCKLAGGGWQTPTAEELATLVDRTKVSPATYDELRKDTKSDWYVASEPWASSSDDVWAAFGNGGVDSLHRDYDGFARGVRRVRVASPGQ